MSDSCLPCADAVGTPDDLQDGCRAVYVKDKQRQYRKVMVQLPPDNWKLQKQVNAFKLSALKRQRDHGKKNHDKKRAMRGMTALGNSFIDNSMTADCQKAGLAFHFAAKKEESRDRNDPGYWVAPTLRKQRLLKELAMKAWGGEVWEMLKAEAVTEILAFKQPPITK